MRRLFLLAFIWGWSFLFIRVVVEGSTPSIVAGGRVAIGAVVLVAALLRLRMGLPRRARDWFHLSVLAVTGSLLPFALIAWAEERIASALAAVLNSATPMFTATVAVFLLGDRLRPPQVAGLVVAFAGVAVLSGAGGSDLSASSPAGVAAVLLASASYGFAFCWARRVLSHLRPLEISAGQLVAGTVLGAPVVAADAARADLHLTPTRLLCLALLGIFGTGIAYVLNYRILTEHGPTAASLVTFLVPVVGVTVGVLVLDEPFSPRLVVGGAVVLAGVALVQWRVLRGEREPRRPVEAVATAAGP